MTLNSQQFPKPGDSLSVNGQDFHFAGYHLTDEPNFKPDPEHEHFENMLGAEPGEVYHTHNPKDWEWYAGDRSYATEVWNRTKSPAEHQAQYPWASDHTAHAWSIQHLPASNGENYSSAWDQGTSDPSDPDVHIGRTHEFNEAFKAHVNSYNTDSKFDNHLALGPGLRRKERWHTITQGPDAGKKAADYSVVRARAYGGLS